MQVEPPANGGYRTAAYVVAAVIYLIYSLRLWLRGAGARWGNRAAPDQAATVASRGGGSTPVPQQRGDDRTQDRSDPVGDVTHPHSRHDRRPERAGRIDGGPGQRGRHENAGIDREADRESADPRRRGGHRRAEDHRHQQEGGIASCRWPAARRMSHDDCRRPRPRDPHGEEPSAPTRPQDRTDALHHDVADGRHQVEPPRHQQPHRHRRIEEPPEMPIVIVTIIASRCRAPAR